MKTERTLGLHIAVADPALTDNTGHCLNYALSLADELQARGHRTRLFGHRGVSTALQSGYGVEPAFSLGFYETDFAGVKSIYPHGPPFWLRPARSIINAWTVRRASRHRLRSALNGEVLLRQTVRDLQFLHSKMRFGRQDLMLLNTVNAIGARGLVRWLRGLPHDQRPIVILLLHYAPQRQNDHSSAMGHWRAFFAERQSAQLEEQVLIAADTNELARDFEAIGGRRVAVTPIPHTGLIEMRATARTGRPLTVVYAGRGTAAKGFHLLPDIVGELADLIQCGAIAFRIQADILDSSADVLDAMTRLRKLNVELIHGSLDRAAYYKLLSTADVLLQPHNPAYYRLQSSGVFAEGRSAGLIAVVPGETTMAQEIARTGGGIAVEQWDAAAYADAIRRCVDEFDRLAAEARAAEPEWRKLHSAQGLVMVLNSILPATHQL